ncbi:PTS system transporter subunit IIA [Niallia circulans]|jgi:sugar PTS system EIIA component|uniref:PTS sugar transporter subunit IIA n=1 Tax=Shouchella clausii TaxID=79880 RepID=A0A268RU99_SHOCL|nr:PTS glucose transporter subunit IIA [Shouchella clausii]PAD42225.1 PTS sugar transporter subunit IIA [Bacillus sp. 7520-S]SPU20972.1 PTS system transporter subunit IIA [Niallia circulans]MCM3549886.1 PTS glucose transporter subunit IIA [Shouchella clausii]MED4160134.1 PTS glucose transporter subunit IIA [Shouchella clausii]MED4178231.1 PTS glucose transporter subunit IIA [Shouchella clausii]
MFGLFNKKSNTFVSPASGTIKLIDQVKDETFSQKMMGDGFAIEPTSSHIYAPINAKVDFVFQTNHAVGLRTDDGKEILIHVGVDTVRLEGKGFTAHIKEGQRVKAGDLLLTVDFDSIQAQVPSTDIILIFTSGEACTVNNPDSKVDARQENIIQLSK